MSVFTVVPGTVSNKLEATNYLANREETNDLGSDDTSSQPLLLREAPYAVQHVDGLCGRRFSGTGACIEEACGVLQRLGSGLEVL